eukprot:15108127-Alexandrium_andersonii.AAC.1
MPHALPKRRYHTFALPRSRCDIATLRYLRGRLQVIAASFAAPQQRLPARQRARAETHSKPAKRC